MPATIRADEIVGRWGLASFQNPNDRARTEAAARGQCKQPYVIGAGQSGGVVMHLADQATPQELRLKGSPGGKNYIGPAGPAARRTGPRDRLVRRPRADHPLHRQGCRGPLRQHGLCPLRAAGVRRAPSRHAREGGHPVRRGFSAESLTSLECWIVRPSAQLRTRRTMTVGWTTQQKTPASLPAFCLVCVNQFDQSNSASMSFCEA